ncbi:MAG: DUF465 domain-containing protein [Rhodospirillales bacterium]|jgi:hypothetical protein|nr:DUF465 domain-containing protein [Rhodospirillales bacterium]HJO72595.1 DUF465 domain-containing protein [Rhodospirillales bacterium]
MANTEALARLLAELKAEHRELDEEIERATENPSFDQLDLQRLKKRKLALKDRITKVESGLLPDIIA